MHMRVQLDTGESTGGVPDQVERLYRFESCLHRL